jgi:porin
MDGDSMHASFGAGGRCFGISAAGCSGRSILHRFGYALGVALTFLVVIGAPSAGSAQIWNNACTSDALLADWGDLRSRLAQDGIGFGLQNQTELWGNLTGGIKQGVEYDGLTTASLCIDLAVATQGQWKARMFASGFQIYGLGPSIPLVGALQLVSSIEATPSTKLYDLWFEQQLFDDKVSLRFGQEGANDELMLGSNERIKLPAYAGLFLNSSFGYPAMLAIGLPSGGPNYPLATPFVRLLYTPSEEISLISAAYTDNPAPTAPGNPQLLDRHGTAFLVDSHVISFAELGYSPAFLKDRNFPGAYKLGMWLANGSFPDRLHSTDGLSLANPESNGIPSEHTKDYGFYAVVNQTIRDGAGVFFQIMQAPDDRNLSNLFIAGGVNWTGPIPSRSNDSAGVAFTYAGIGGAARSFSQDEVANTGAGSPYAQGEMIIEATYQLQPKKWFALQPDLQYVINPGAGIPTAQSAAPLKNALVLGVRVTVNF